MATGYLKTASPSPWTLAALVGALYAEHRALHGAADAIGVKRSRHDKGSGYVRLQLAQIHGVLTRLLHRVHKSRRNIAPLTSAISLFADATGLS